MYLFIPDVFLVPVCYDEEDILNIKNKIIYKKWSCDNSFANKTVKREEIVIGVSLPDRVIERWDKERTIMEEYAQSKGVTLKVENAESDAAKQASQVDDLISQGISVLILVPVDLLSAADLVEKAHKAGVKVIDYDRLIQNSDSDLYISFNGTRVGQLQGQYLTEKVPKGKYIIMSGDTRDYNSKLFKDGAMEYIQPYANIGNIKIVADKVITGWDPNIAFKIVEDALNANKNKIDAILAPNDSSAGAAIEALKAQDLAGKVAVTGQDAELAAIRRIIQGTQLMTVFKDTRELAKTSIDTAIKLAKGENIKIDKGVNNGKIDVPSILINPIAIDKNNIDSVLIGSGYLKEEDVHEEKKQIKQDKAENRKDIVIGVSLPTQREDIWVRFKKDMEDYAKDKGVTVKIENPDFDAAKQTLQIENLISQGIDVLVVIPVKELNGAAMAEKAHKVGVKVISYEAPMQNSNIDLYIDFNKIRVGELQGKYLTEKVPKGNYIILSGDPDGIFKEGAMEYIQPLVARKNIKIVADQAVKNWDPKIAYNVVKDALIANNNKIDAILAPNDAIAGAAIQALQEQDLAGKVAVTGQDADIAAIRRIIQRTQSMTVFKDTRKAAKTIIDSAIKLTRGEEIEINAEVNNGKINVPSILLTPVAVDKGNIENVLIDSGYLKAKDLY